MSETKKAKIERLTNENEALIAEVERLTRETERARTKLIGVSRERDGLRGVLLDEQANHRRTHELLDSTMSRLLGLHVDIADALGIETAPGDDEDVDTILVDAVRALVLGADTSNDAASRAAGRQEALDVVLDHLRTRLSELDSRKRGKSTILNIDREPLARIAGAETEVAILIGLARETMLAGREASDEDEDDDDDFTKLKRALASSLGLDGDDASDKLLEAVEALEAERSALANERDRLGDKIEDWRRWAFGLIGKGHEDDHTPAVDLRDALERAYTHQVDERQKAELIADALRLVVIGERCLSGLGFRWES